MKLELLLSRSCLWLTIILPMLVVLGRGVADFALTFTAILFLLLSLIKKDIKPFKEKWFMVFISFWVYMVARSFFADDMIIALKKSVPIIRYALFALCFQHILTEEENPTKKIICSLAIATAFVSINGYMQYFLGKDLFGGTEMLSDGYGRITSSLTTKPTIASTLLILSTPLIYYSLYQLIKLKKHIFPSIAFCFFIYFLVFLSAERSAFLQVTILIFTASFYLSDFKPKIIGGTILISIFAMFLLYNFGAKPLIERQFFSILDSLKNFESNPYGKLWIASTSIFLDNFLFGVGPFHFEKYCLPISDFCNYHSHNIYLELLSETGIIGFTLFAATIYYILKPSIQNLNKNHHVLNIISAAIVIFILVRWLPFMPYTGLFKNWYAVPIWFMIGWLLHVNAILRKRTQI